MVRPCFLIIDPEYPGSISTRKLVIETAKFNVITAYSEREAVETLAAFPAIQGVVMNSDTKQYSCDDLVKELKGIKAEVPIISICGPGDPSCKGADHELTSFDPRELLELLKKIKPAEVAGIEKHEEKLERNG